MHNFLRKEYRSDVGEFPVDRNTQQNTGNTENTNQAIPEEPLETQEQDRENANIWRKTMAENMRKDAIGYEDP